MLAKSFRKEGCGLSVGLAVAAVCATTEMVDGLQKLFAMIHQATPSVPNVAEAIAA